jgi:electron transport complex protein RnfC
VVAVPTRYPAGGAKQLIRVLTGKEVPASKRSTELGVQCFNVATAYTAYRALAHGEPVISRIVTLTGNVEQPRNWEVRLGTPMRDLVALGQPKADTDRYLMGGPMMGFEMPTSRRRWSRRPTASSPVRRRCSRRVRPRCRASVAAPAPRSVRTSCNLSSCTGSRAPGTSARRRSTTSSTASNAAAAATFARRTFRWCSTFRFAKSEIWSREREKQAADAAKARFELRNARAEREQAEKAERLAKGCRPGAANGSRPALRRAETVAVVEAGVSSARQRS